MAETLAARSQRNEVFWLGFAAVVLGVVIPESVAVGGLNLSSWFLVSGGGLLITSVFVGIYRLITPT